LTLEPFQGVVSSMHLREVRMTTCIALILAGAVSTAALAAAQHQHHEAVAARGAAVMGFDQQQTVHRFALYEDGGAIDVSIRDAADAANLAAIRSHLPHIAAMFTGGRFDAPMLVHATDVPGTREMTALKDRITYTYEETPRGGRVDIVTRDRDAVAAVHRFLRFQIADHRTGDSTAVTPR
jgi:hypothetical protein